MRDPGMKLAKDLARHFDGDLLFSSVHRAMYARDASPYRVMPWAVARPRGAGDVEKLLEWAKDHEIPVHCRGSGSGLTGSCLGEGLVLDFRFSMNSILEIDVQKKLARVQPGLVHGLLNKTLEKHGLFFPPDPASGAFCTIGGMVANNSSGARSVKYGATIDYVRSIEAFTPRTGLFRAHHRHPGNESPLLSELSDLLDKELDKYLAHLPKAPKNCSGYRLERARGANDNISLANILTGSEGTLAVMSEMELALEVLPRTRRLCLVNFPSLESMSEAVVAVLPMGPSALEVMDHQFLDIVRDRRPELSGFLPEGSKAQLLIEFDGDHEETEHLAAELRRMYGNGNSAAIDFFEATDPDEQRQLWSVRKAALPFLFTLPGPGKITPFIEDVSIAPKHLAFYLRKLHEIFDEHGVTSAVYGHAGDGNLHTRPILDLRRERDVQLMRRMASQVLELTLELDGSISGEHGDGRLRTHSLPRLLGDGYAILEKTKKIFDPAELLNPGIIAGSKTVSMTENLRPHPGPADAGQSSARPSGWIPDRPGLAEAIDVCHGCGQCTTPENLSRMCPLYKVTNLPQCSPRGKSALAQELLSGGIHPEDREVREIFSCCLGCGLCETECPSRVKTSYIVKEIRALTTAKLGLPLSCTIISRLSSPPSCTLPLLWAGTRLARLGPVRQLLEKLMSIHRKAPLFEFACFPAKEVRREPSSVNAVYFPDTYAALCDPGLADLCMKLLRMAGFTAVTSPDLVSAAPALSSGDPAAASSVAVQVQRLIEPYLTRDIPVVFSEPTALRVIREDFPRILKDSSFSRKLALNAVSLCRALEGKLDIQSDSAAEGIRIAYHTPCHVRGTPEEASAPGLLRSLGYDVTVLSTSCCGMAGAFGLSSDVHGFDMSSRVGRPVFEAIKDLSPAYIASECSACRLQLAAHTGRPALHPLRLLDMILDGGRPRAAGTGGPGLETRGGGRKV